jgi:hypothetical protein
VGLADALERAFRNYRREFRYFFCAIQAVAVLALTRGKRRTAAGFD